MLELKHISYTVREDGNELGILNDISLTIDDHKLVVFTGPNGGGKTTLAKIIMGLVKPTSGQILWNGQDITDLGITERARLGISYGFQQPPRFKGLTVRNLLTLASGDDKLSKDKCCQYLTRVGLCANDYLDREVDVSLSGGEVKRIEIASILARNSQLMIFDEPEAGIDLWSFARLTETFEQLPLNHDQVEDAINFIVENMNVSIRFYKGNAFSVEAPNFVELTVTQTEPGFKGDTATGTTKPATLETGYKINVPLFVNEGDRIRVDTRTGEYMERV